MVSECTRSMWDTVVKCVQSPMAGKVPQPQNKSFQTVQEFVADPFTTVKMALFLSAVAR